MHIRCPHCHNAIEIVGDSDLLDVTCPSCGSEFNLLPETKSWTPAPQWLDHFQLLDKVGTGSFGTIWKARDTKLDRLVAVKLPRRMHASLAEEASFLREARAASQLRHSGIVPVHEVGRQESGELYIVSGFVQGVTLADRLTSGPFTSREAAILGAQIADALHYAHESGVIHRDLKPANIMLDAGGLPHLMDFGLAKREAGEITMTIEGKVLGTPAYMSPEQARGKGHDVDRRTDVYSLGVILFELLTGELPFRGNVRMLLHQVIYDDPPSPRKLNSRIPRDLETICLKCLEKTPGRRYATANDVAQELRRWLDGKPILSRPITSLERGIRWAQRNPLVASLGSVVLVLLMTVACVSSWFYFHAAGEARAETKRAAEKSAIAERMTRLAGEKEALAGKLANSVRTEKAARLLAQENATKAQQNAAAARDQSLLALQVLSSTIAEVQRLEGVPGAREARQRLLRTIVQQLEELSEEFVGRSSGDQLTHEALVELGELILYSGEGEPGGPEVGSAPVAAQRLFMRSLEIARSLKAADPEDPKLAQAEAAEARSLEMLGDAELQLGNEAEALGFYEQARAIYRSIKVARLYHDFEREVSRCHGKLGHAWLDSGRASQALVHYELELSLDQKHHANQPGPAAIERLASSHTDVGDALLALRRFAEALPHYRESLTMSKLLAADASDVDAQRGLSIAHERLGDVLLEMGQHNEAVAEHRESLAISRVLLTADPRDAGSQRDVSIAHERLGDALLRANDLEGARKEFESMLGWSQELARDYPNDPQVKIDLSHALAKYGDILLRLNDAPGALAQYQLRMKTSEQTAADFPDHLGAKFDVPIAKVKTATAHLALGDAQSAIACCDETISKLDSLRELVQPKDPQSNYDLACVHSTLVDVLRAATPNPNESQGAALKTQTAAALEALQQAIDAGYSDFWYMSTDADLRPLRELPEFQEMIKPR